ncbi:MAG: hypothetical protein LBT14_14515 [Treponema sp.]|jgi:hypothetical protein|nr:hypothetical protein [Treponema sp.]
MKKLLNQVIVMIAEVLMIIGCGTTGGAVTRGKINRSPDPIGNVNLRNEAGVDSDVYVLGKYVKTIPVGAISFAINVPDVSPTGTPVRFEIFDSGANKGHLDSPKPEARFRVFTQPLFPSSDRDRVRNIVLVRNPDDAPLPAIEGYSDMLVEFSYPFEIPQIGDVTAEVFVGQVNSRRTLLSLAPGDKPVSVPMTPGFNQFTTMYYVSNNNAEHRFYFPDWANESEAQVALVSFDGTVLTPSYQIRPISSIGKITWVYPKDNQGQLYIKNVSSKASVINARSLGVGGRSGTIDSSEFSIGARAGSSSIPVGAPMVPFALKPGKYQFVANNPIPGNLPVDKLDEIDIEAGSTYYWIIKDSGSTLEKKGDASSALASTLQNWKLSSNVSGATVTLYISSATPDVETDRKEIGKTDSKGTFAMQAVVTSLFPKLTYENASQVMIKINVGKEGWVDETQAISALTLLQSGSDFTPVPFTLKEEASQTTPGVTYKIEKVNFYVSSN